MELTVRIGDVYKANNGEELLLIDIQNIDGHMSYFLYSMTLKTMYCYHNDYIITKMEFIKHLDEVPKHEDFISQYEQCDNCGLIKTWVDVIGTQCPEMLYTNSGVFCCNECYNEWMRAMEHGKIDYKNKNLERMYKEQELKDKEYLYLIRQLNKYKA